MASKASAVWTGSLKEGKGTISTATGVLNNANYSFATRFEGADARHHARGTDCGGSRELLLDGSGRAAGRRGPDADKDRNPGGRDPGQGGRGLRHHQDRADHHRQRSRRHARKSSTRPLPTPRPAARSRSSLPTTPRSRWTRSWCKRAGPDAAAGAQCPGPSLRCAEFDTGCAHLRDSELLPAQRRAAERVYRAEVAELADARGSGPRTRKGVGVRVPSSAPSHLKSMIYRHGVHHGVHKTAVLVSIVVSTSPRKFARDRKRHPSEIYPRRKLPTRRCLSWKPRPKKAESSGSGRCPCRPG